MQVSGRNNLSISQKLFLVERNLVGEVYLLISIFSHFWLMERIFIQNRQNNREIFQKLSANSKVFLGTLYPRYIAFSTYVYHKGLKVVILAITLFSVQK